MASGGKTEYLNISKHTVQTERKFPAGTRKLTDAWGSEAVPSTQVLPDGLLRVLPPSLNNPD